jgi:two-component sensor histidine kinase
MKYAFPDGESGEISISFHQVDDKYILEVKDNGIGIPKDLDIVNAKSLGLQLVTSLTDQINGDLELNRENGTDFKIIFKEKEFQ